MGLRKLCSLVNRNYFNIFRVHKNYFMRLPKHIKITCPNQRKLKYTPEYYLSEAYRWLTNIVDRLR